MRPPFPGGLATLYPRLADGAGRLALVASRLRDEQRQRSARTPGVATPLRCGPRLKELMSRHYLHGRWADRVGPVAWVTSGAPVEFLKALGYHVHYPENHGAVCGIRRKAEDLFRVAEEAGWSTDLCSYARTDFGALLSGRTPVGRLPRPHLLVCCTNICQTVLSWYRILAHHLDVPLVVIDTPFLYDEATAAQVAYVKAQVEEAVSVAERVARRGLDPRELEATTRRSKEAVGLWMQVLETARHHPAPFSAFDAFIHMSPVVQMRGEASTVAYYACLLGELEERNRAGVAAVVGERWRLVWDNLPIWPRVRWLSERLSERKVALVASTYTQAWGELYALINPEDPMESAARVHLSVLLNRGTGHKLRTLSRIVADYGAHGVLLHSDRSCKPYSVGQLDQASRLSSGDGARGVGVPALLIEADHNDPRAFSEEQVATRLYAFLETLGVEA